MFGFRSLNSKTKWDLISEVTGGSVVYDSSKYSELYFEIQDPNNMVFCFNIPTISLNDTERNYMNGAYSGSVHYWVVLRATTTEAHLEWSTTDYNNVGSLAPVSKIKVYGKRC